LRSFVAAAFITAASFASVGCVTPVFSGALTTTTRF
jgi:hypothetical protein